MTYRHIAAMAAGFALDCLIGDPANWPHPVRLVGKEIELEEGMIRNYLLPAADKAGDRWPLDRARTEQLAGALLAFDIATISPFVVSTALKVCDKVHPVLGFAAETFLCYQLLAARSLRDESMKVYDALAREDVPQARKAVAMIVGRDTDCLDGEGVARAAVETVAENTSDGVVAPLLFMGVGGAPAAMAYKAVNTLDSMAGYKNERYINLGRAGAKLDDLLNFVPARIAGVLMCGAARFVGMNANRAWKVFKRDRLNHTSPNSAHTEAACAGALGVQLGGGNYYFGEYVEKPTIGDATRPIEAEDIPRANRLMYATAALGLGLAACIGVGVSIVGHRVRGAR